MSNFNLNPVNYMGDCILGEVFQLIFINGVRRKNESAKVVI